MPLPPLAEHEPPFSVSPAATVQLGQSLEQAVLWHADAMNRLRLAVDACVIDLHKLGMTPERVLITIKALVRHTAAEHPPPGYAPSSDAADAFLRDIVRWLIVAYFQLEPPLPDGFALPAPPPDAGLS